MLCKHRFHHPALVTDVSTIYNVTKPGDGVKCDQLRDREILELCCPEMKKQLINHVQCPISPMSKRVQLDGGLLTLNGHYCLHKFYINYIFDHLITLDSSQ